MLTSSDRFSRIIFSGSLNILAGAPIKTARKVFVGFVVVDVSDGDVVDDADDISDAAVVTVGLNLLLV